MASTNASFSHFSNIIVNTIYYKQEQIICQKISSLFLKWRFYLLILYFENISFTWAFFQQIDLSGLGVRDYCLCLCTEPSTALISVMHPRLDLLHVIHTVINSHSSSVIRYLLAVNIIQMYFLWKNSFFKDTQVSVCI